MKVEDGSLEGYPAAHPQPPYESDVILTQTGPLGGTRVAARGLGKMDTHGSTF